MVRWRVYLSLSKNIVVLYLLTMWINLVILLEDIRDEMKLNANITKVLSEAKSNFSDDEHEV